MGRKGQVRVVEEGHDERYIFFLHCQPLLCKVVNYVSLMPAGEPLIHPACRLPQACLTRSGYPWRKSPQSLSRAGASSEHKEQRNLRVWRRLRHHLSSAHSHSHRQKDIKLILKNLQGKKLLAFSHCWMPCSQRSFPYNYPNAACCSSDWFFLLWVSEGTDIKSLDEWDVGPSAVPSALPRPGTPLGKSGDHFERDGGKPSLSLPLEIKCSRQITTLTLTFWPS